MSTSHSVCEFSSNQPSEDRYSVRIEPDISVFCVIDGHGGCFACELAEKHLVDMLLKDLRTHDIKTLSPSAVLQIFESIFKRCDETILQEAVTMQSELNRHIRYPGRIGCCVAIAAIIAGRLYTAHVGDCRVVLCRDIPNPRNARISARSEMTMTVDTDGHVGKRMRPPRHSSDTTDPSPFFTRDFHAESLLSTQTKVSKNYTDLSTITATITKESSTAALQKSDESPTVLVPDLSKKTPPCKVAAKTDSSNLSNGKSHSSSGSGSVVSNLPVVCVNQLFTESLFEAAIAEEAKKKEIAALDISSGEKTLCPGSVSAEGLAGDGNIPNVGIVDIAVTSVSTPCAPSLSDSDRERGSEDSSGVSTGTHRKKRKRKRKEEKSPLEADHDFPEFTCAVPQYQMHIHCLTKDHSCDDKAELQGVRALCPNDPGAVRPSANDKKRFGRDALKRVGGSLSVTRALGDGYLKVPFLSEEPYVRHVPYITCLPSTSCRVISPGTDLALVIASDGLWNYMEPTDVAFVLRMYLNQLSQKASSSIARCVDGVAVDILGGEKDPLNHQQSRPTGESEARGEHEGSKSHTEVSSVLPAGGNKMEGTNQDSVAVATPASMLLEHCLRNAAAAGGTSYESLKTMSCGPYKRNLVDDITVIVVLFETHTASTSS